MEDVERFATATDPVLACCLCSRLIEEAALLKCLHSCCRRCFNAAASSGSRRVVACGLCDTITQAGAERPNDFVDRQVQRYRSIAESRVCRPCNDSGEPDKPALVWCVVCRNSFCGDCVAAHRQLWKLHVTQSLDELRNLVDECAPLSLSVCGTHKEPVNVACLTCKQAKCLSCCAECMEKKHELSGVGQPSFEKYVGDLVASVSAKESEMLKKLETLEKPKAGTRDTLAARDRHLKEIQERKRCIVEAVSKVYDEVELSTKSMYDKLQAESEAAAVAAERLASSMSDAKDYIRRLMQSIDKFEILNQQGIVQERLQNLTAEVDAILNKLAMSRTVKIDALLPKDLEKIVRQWIGTPALYSVSSSSTTQPHPPPAAQQQQYLSFGSASGSSLQLPVSCCDVALTKDGRRLLAAAWRHGLIELCCSSGRELSRWQQDCVQAVTALSDGRAAVSLVLAQCVVLLRSSNKSNKTGRGGTAAAAGNAAWTEDCRLDRLPWRPGFCLSAHGDILAVPQCMGTGRLQLLSLRSGRQLTSERQINYEILSLAVASRVVVTLSSSKVNLGDGHGTWQVLDAHSLDDGDKRLWRFEVEQEVELHGVCADSAGGCLYAAVQRSDKSSGRVWALSLADGSELRRVVLIFSSAAAAAAEKLLPVRLSLSDDGAAAEQQQQESRSRSRGLLLAVLSSDLKTVNVHSSSS